MKGSSQGQGDILSLIKSRRSVRCFKSEKISPAIIDKIIESASWAPSGLNNQPWKFKVLRNKEKDSLSGYTKYGKIIKEADCALCVFLDKKVSYNYEKDLLAVGAAIQNILLYVHSIKLGACWLGEILNQRQEINIRFNIPETFQLEAVIALGFPAKTSPVTKRKSIKEIKL
ncbi:MAG: nitroreductase [Candidatus Omnitrophica bacterium]|nr:nitroreductase [Candidatus Omnitrophota bacterium]